MDISKRYKLRKFIKELEKIRGRHTELVSVYVPAGYDINKVIQHLEQEQSTAKNIKDARTRNNVIDSLERAIRHLRLYKRIPEHGLAIFAGNASENESKIDIQVWSIEPPEPIAMRLYRCDQYFVLDLLKEQMEVSEAYGLIVLDKREGTVGLLKGSRVEVLVNLTSGVPGKFKTGGQCLSQDVIIMKDDGEIIEIKEAHNPLLVQSENFNTEMSEHTPILTKWENKKELFKIITCYPRTEIMASGDHTFFVRTDKGIEEKKLCELGVGDYLLMPEKINTVLEEQLLDFVPKIKYMFNTKKVFIPKTLTSDLAQLFGYYLGDGSYEIDRLTFFEQREEVAIYYRDFIKNLFKIDCDLRFRKSKNYYQIRVYSRILSQLFKKYFAIVDKTLNGRIPQIILKSPDNILAAFILGFFDAEGYISGTRVALGINNKFILRQLQFSFLRLGIISSILEYNNKRNPYSKNFRYTLVIEDIVSLKEFTKLIGFSSKEKYDRLKSIISKRSNTNKTRQIVVNGRDIANMLRNSGYTTTEFKNPGFFTNKRQLSKEIFRTKILDEITDDDLKRRLSLFYSSNLIAVKIKNIQSVGMQKTVDIETKNHNFIANGLIVHNSAARFQRLREEMAKEFYNRIGNAANKQFLGMKELKGIIVGGPGPTKEEFLDGHYLNNEIKRKVLGVKDLGYTGEDGLHEMVDKSGDILEKQEGMIEKVLVQKLFELLAKEPEKVAYGRKDVEKAIGMGAVDTLLLSESLNDEDIEGLSEKAEKYGSKVQIISVESREGVQLKELSGIAAILRYAVS